MFYQDRFGTNLGKTQKKGPFFRRRLPYTIYPNKFTEETPMVRANGNNKTPFMMLKVMQLHLKTFY